MSGIDLLLPNAHRRFAEIRNLQEIAKMSGYPLRATFIKLFEFWPVRNILILASCQYPVRRVRPTSTVVMPNTIVISESQERRTIFIGDMR